MVYDVYIADTKQMNRKIKQIEIFSVSLSITFSKIQEVY